MTSSQNAFLIQLTDLTEAALKLQDGDWEPVFSGKLCSWLKKALDN